MEGNHHINQVTAFLIYAYRIASVGSVHVSLSPQLSVRALKPHISCIPTVE